MTTSSCDVRRVIEGLLLKKISVNFFSSFLATKCTSSTITNVIKLNESHIPINLTLTMVH